MEGIVKVRVKGVHVFWGNGIMELLGYVNQYHSLRKACEQMQMSYSKGCRIIKLAEQELGFPLLITKRGGAQGGSSILTEDGKRFSECYKKYYDNMMTLGREIFANIFEPYL